MLHFIQSYFQVANHLFHLQRIVGIQDAVHFCLYAGRQDIGFVHQDEVVGLDSLHPFFPNDGFQQFQRNSFVGKELPVTFVVGVVGRLELPVQEEDT
ncbi:MULTISPECIES: hypothetical protein [unclassified Neomoorella]|uniref:hypothetical protein n=1 Tax=unclassified Neomoorella TaxID=2676739 RepID=UPI00155A633B|nr:MULTISPECIES: hypothetical protein [unclassified Moorella (in: firmicutes)]